MKQHERILQKQAVTWFRLQYPQIKDLLFSIPNSQEMSWADKRSAAKIMAMLKAGGLTPGIPDLMLAVPRINREGDDMVVNYAGLFIEMKVKPNKPSDKQKHIHDQLIDQGYLVKVIYTLDEFMELINWYLGKKGRYPV